MPNAFTFYELSADYIIYKCRRMRAAVFSRVRCHTPTAPKVPQATKKLFRSGLTPFSIRLLPRHAFCALLCYTASRQIPRMGRASRYLPARAPCSSGLLAAFIAFHRAAHRFLNAEHGRRRTPSSTLPPRRFRPRRRAIFIIRCAARQLPRREHDARAPRRRTPCARRQQRRFSATCARRAT